MKEEEKYNEKWVEMLGKRIKELRKKKGYTSSETFAYENDFNRSQYGKYEVGINMRFNTLMRIIKLLGVTPEEFFSEGFEEEELEK